MTDGNDPTERPDSASRRVDEAPGADTSASAVTNPLVEAHPSEGGEPSSTSTAEPPADTSSEAESAADDDTLRELLKSALSDDMETQQPDVLRGVQGKLRRRSRGKFYADYWSTAQHPPVLTYLITSLAMLVVVTILFVLLSPWIAAPRDVRPQPAPASGLDD